METKANYVTVGAFTLLILLAGFIMVYWVARVDTSGQTTRLDVVIEGSVTGLGVGSLVKFNGIDVGKVTGLSFDERNPRIVIARTVVNRNLPISSETKAVLGFTGLTGIAHIELEGGSIDRPNIFQLAEEQGTIATIEADPSAVNNLLATAQDIFDRTDRVLSELEGFVADARGPLSTTLDNTAVFSEALKDNADNIDNFLEGIGGVGNALADVSGKLDGTLQGIEKLLAAVDPDKISSIVDNVDVFTADMRNISGQIQGVSDSVSEVVANLQGVGTRINNSFDKVDSLLDAVPPEQVVTTVEDLSKAGESARTALAEFDTLLKSVDPDKISSIVENTDTFTADMKSVSGQIQGVADSVTKIASDLEDVGTRINGTFDRVNGTFEKVDSLLDAVPPDQVTAAVDNLAKAGDSARTALNEVESLTKGLGERQEDIQTIISNTQEMAERLNAASVRVDGILAKADSLLGSDDGQGLMTDARATLQSFKKAADTLNTRINSVSVGLERFSDSGLRDIQALVNETRRSVSRIEQAISDLERNPQRLIFGGDGGVKTYDGRERR